MSRKKYLSKTLSDASLYQFPAKHNIGYVRRKSGAVARNFMRRANQPISMEKKPTAANVRFNYSGISAGKVMSIRSRRQDRQRSQR